MKTPTEWSKWMNENPMPIGPHAGTTDAYEEACQRAFEARIAMVQEDARAGVSTTTTEPTTALELASAERVAASCTSSGHWANDYSCPSCIVAYAQQLRENQRAMREALEREQEASKGLREQNAALVEALNVTKRFGRHSIGCRFLRPLPVGSHPECDCWLEHVFAALTLAAGGGK